MMTTLAETDAEIPRAQVLLVDDHPIVRQGVARLIERQNDLSVYTVSPSLKPWPRSTPPDSPIDLMLEGGSGIDLIQTLHSQLPPAHPRLIYA